MQEDPISKYRAIILTTEDVGDLYKIEIELTEYSGTLHKNIMLADSGMEQSEAKSRLSLCNAMIGVCKERQADVKDHGSRLNHRFKMAAKYMLTPETFQAIEQKARLLANQIKSESGTLKQNRVNK